MVFDDTDVDYPSLFITIFGDTGMDHSVLVLCGNLSLSRQHVEDATCTSGLEV